MKYEVLSLITNVIYFDDVASMISVKVLCKMSYEIFTTNIKRLENIAKMFQKIFINYGLDKLYINEFVTNSEYLLDTLRDMSNALLNNHYYTFESDYSFRIINYNNCNKILYENDKLSPFKHLKMREMVTIRKQLKKSPLFQMALDHPMYQKKSYIYNISL